MRYTLTEKESGKEVLNLPCNTPAEKKEANHQATEIMAANTGVTFVGSHREDSPAESAGQASAEGVSSTSTNSPANSTPDVIKAEAKMPGKKQARKPRKDKGVSRTDKPAPKKRKVVYHLITGTFTVELINSKAELDKALNANGKENNPLQIIKGGKLVRVDVQYVLK